jgi:hypothetical protein
MDYREPEAVPSFTALVVKKGSKMRCFVVSSVPLPVSTTTNSICDSLAAGRSVTVIVPGLSPIAC